MRVVVKVSGTAEQRALYEQALRANLRAGSGMHIQVLPSEDAPIARRPQVVQPGTAAPVPEAFDTDCDGGLALQDVCEIEQFEDDAGLLEADVLFYDGGCGLCHKSVEFAADKQAVLESFVFAPLHGELFSEIFDCQAAATLPDSLIVRTREGETLTRSDAVLFVLERAGGKWSLASKVLAAVPTPLRNFGYNLLAKVRKRLFKKPSDVCPMLPAEVRERFRL